MCAQKSGLWTHQCVANISSVRIKLDFLVKSNCERLPTLVKRLFFKSSLRSNTMSIRESFLSEDVPSMGIYETLYAFRDSWGAFMGTQGTHPWSQGFPLTTQLKDG